MSNWEENANWVFWVLAVAIVTMGLIWFCWSPNV